MSTNTPTRKTTTNRVPRAPEPRSDADRSAPFAGLLNEVRSDAGAPAVTPEPRLAAAAERHAEDMAARGFISHDGSDGSTPQDRVTDAGYASCMTAENIALQPDTERELVTQWMNSPAHRTNMLRGNADAFGLAQAGGYWVLVLARPC